MKKYLRCVQGSSSFTAGKRYEIVNENRSDYSVRNDAGVVELFSKKPDDHGLSYRDWFELEPKDDAPITVLPDESLGGVMREYREVKRKAAVGERVKIVADQGAELGEDYGYSNGEIHVVVSMDGERDVNIRPDGTEDTEIYLEMDEYVVLEPSDIIAIDEPDGVCRRYRMVDRKAAVGERVVVTNAVSGYGYKQGDVYEIKTLDCDDPCIWPDGTYKSEVYLEQHEYRVLEPVNSAAAPQLSELPASDQIAENIAALAARVTLLEAKVDELGEAVRAVLEGANPSELSMSKSEVEAAIEVFSQPIPPQQVRDEIVERAKADVKDLANLGEYRAPNGKYTKAEFVINREKRKVTVILRGACTGNIYAVGRAICAKNDVFNAAIGRAIALRRALGLEVPAEYLSVPNPEEPRVGDVVKYASGGVKTVVSDAHMNLNPRTETRLSLARLVGTILDDSREEVAA